MFDHPALQTLSRDVVRLGRLRSALGLLGWDQETFMPKGGAATRAGVIGDLTEVVHRMATAPELGDRLAAAEEAASDPVAQAFCREVRRGYDRSVKVPAELAEEIARTASETQGVWAKARGNDDFATFQPYLEKLLGLKRRYAEAVQEEGGDLYDTLLDEYEPGCKGAQVQEYVDAVKPVLVGLVERYGPISAQTPAEFMDSGGFDVDAQREFSTAVIRELGFDFEHGRVDVSTHPFCSGFSPRDVRLTTRYNPDNLESLFSLIHEAGHGLYEQGLDSQWEATPLGEAVSLGIHESQSRLWENIVARGRPFWTHFYPRLQAGFGAKLEGVDQDTFLRAANRVRPSLIRVEADEVTYSLHIMLRFELEKQLVAGEVAVGDLPGIWKERMGEYLGVVPETDRDGVLQDIHWSFGAFGYFPTYFLGNLFAAQFYDSALEALPGLEEGFARGEFAPLREWLREQVHQPGRRYPAFELCERVTGEPLDPGRFNRSMTAKMAELYD